MKKHSGITLIALIITIIVLLILAGVALSIVAGNEGILSKAEKAVSETRISAAKEQAELMVAGISAEFYEKKYVDRTESGSLVDYIKTSLASGKLSSNGEYTVTVDNSGNVTVTDDLGNETVVGTLNENGKITWSKTTDGETGSSGDSGEVIPEPTDAKYFAFVPNGDGTATITGVNDEYAEKIEVDGIFCTPVIKDGETYITDVVIPSEVTNEEGNTYTVIGIGDFAFVGDPSGTSMIQFTSFRIPDTVQSIGKGAFAYCVSLDNVIIGNSVTTIGDGAFVECTSLNSITIPNSVKFIDEYAFLGWTSSQTIYCYFDSAPITWDERWYDDCNAKVEWLGEGEPIEENETYFTFIRNATNVTITGIKQQYIEEGTEGRKIKDGSNYITSFNIPVEITDADGNKYTVTGISENAFANCKDVTSINIPNSVTNISGSAFANCTGLNEIILVAGNTAYIVEDGILYDTNKTIMVLCERDKQGKIEIPSTVTIIDDYAFQACTEITEIETLSGSRLSKVGECAFADCTNLGKVYFVSLSYSNYGYHCFYKTSGKVINLYRGSMGQANENYNPLYFKDLPLPQ